MGEKRTVALLLSEGADPFIYQRQHPYDDRENGPAFVHYVIARGHLDIVIDALDRLGELYCIEARQSCSQLAVMIMISTRSSMNANAAFFSELVKNLADVNISIQDRSQGVNDNNLMHYMQSAEDAMALVRCGFDRFNSRNSDGKLAINSLVRYRCPALIRFCIDNGTDIRNKDNQGRTILFDLLSCLGSSCADWVAWETLDTVRLCLNAGADIFETDNCKCPCSPDGCTISCIFRTDFPLSPLSAGLGLLWSLEWVTLVDEHRGIEAARGVLLSLLRRVKSDPSDLDITHVCSQRGRGIATGRRRWYDDQPRPLADDDIAEILDDESEFIDILEIEMDQLASDSFFSLRSSWMSVVKAKYNAHVEEVNRARARSEPRFPEERVSDNKVPL